MALNSHMCQIPGLWDKTHHEVFRDTSLSDLNDMWEISFTHSEDQVYCLCILYMLYEGRQSADEATFF